VILLRPRWILPPLYQRLFKKFQTSLWSSSKGCSLLVQLFLLGSLWKAQDRVNLGTHHLTTWLKSFIWMMCNAFDYAIGVILCQRVDRLPHVIFYASKTLNDAQLNYSTTEKELFAVVFALDKFRPYLISYKVLVFTDHEALKYLLTKKDTKACLIR